MSQDAGTGRSSGDDGGRPGSEGLGALADEVERTGEPVVTDAPGDDQADEELDPRDSEYEAGSAAGAAAATTPAQDTGDGRGEDALTDR